MEVDDEEEDKIQAVRNKNSDGLNSSEIIAALSLEFVQTSEHFYNPISNKPFHLKFGKQNRIHETLSSWEYSI